MSNKLIDVERIIRQKNPRLLKWLPRFIVRYFKKILHQEEINEFIEKHKDFHNADFCNKVLENFKVSLKSSGTENIPKEGGYIFVANHPLGAMDAMAIVSVVTPIRTDINFIVNDVLLHLENLKNLFVGVNKFGKNAKDSLTGVNELFAANKAVFVFPAGYVSRKINGKIKDVEWKKTFVSQAIKNNKPIIPIYVSGELSPFFYRLSNFRRFIGIKLNIEMFYLADEMFQQQNKTLEIIFGKPILPQDFPHGKSHKEIAQEIKETVYSLKN